MIMEYMVIGFAIGFLWGIASSVSKENNPE